MLAAMEYLNMQIASSIFVSGELIRLWSYGHSEDVFISTNLDFLMHVSAVKSNNGITIHDVTR